jgi:MFS family permease
LEASANLPSKGDLLSFQETWMRRAGWLALAGAFIVAASIVYQRAGLDLPDSDSDADQLVFAHAHSGRLIFSSILQALGFCLFTPVLYVLFRSAAGRAERVRGAFLALVLLGPLSFGIGLAVSAAGTSNAADKFVKDEPAKVQQARANATANEQQSSAAPKQGKGTGPATTTTTPTATGSTTAAPAAARTPDEAAHDAREDLADDTNRDEALEIGGGIVSTIGVLALVFGMIYTSIWCMRVGLLTRFWGALGIAFGLFLVIPIFPPVPGLVLWFAAISLMFIGVWPRPLPPAWAAGEAKPWLPADQDIGPPSEGVPPGTVEGSGREVAEPPLPENGAGAEQPGETQGQRRKKRKRRK